MGQGNIVSRHKFVQFLHGTYALQLSCQSTQKSMVGIVIDIWEKSCFEGYLDHKTEATPSLMEGLIKNNGQVCVSILFCKYVVYQ